jgi:hypothetical protein
MTHLGLSLSLMALASAALFLAWLSGLLEDEG